MISIRSGCSGVARYGWATSFRPEWTTREARRAVAPGSRIASAVSFGDARSRTAVGLERTERTRGAVSQAAGRGGARRRHAIDGGDGTLHAEPGIREAAAGRSLHRPHRRGTSRSAPRACDALHRRPGAGRGSWGPRTRRGVLQGVQRSHRRPPRDGGRAAVASGPVRFSAGAAVENSDRRDDHERADQ